MGNKVIKSGLVQASSETDQEKDIAVALNEGEDYRFWACFDEDSGKLTEVDSSGKVFTIPMAMKVNQKHLIRVS